ncbi:MAG TPA: hypothetical protein VKB54_18900 [Solirubrobacteraceae bacterium]|nr:hypothetical protein [Solirubrobacteraceae bacterium]
MSKPRQIIAATAAVALLVGGGAAALAAGGDTTVTVSPPTQLTAGQKAPFDAPGVKAIRQGKAIPKGYVLVGQKVQYKIGAKTAGAALKFSCPNGKVLKTFGITGKAGFLALRDYPDHHQTDIISYPPPNTKDASGTVYAVCR